jgi:hypothetical protein
MGNRTEKSTQDRNTASRAKALRLALTRPRRITIFRL